MLLGTKSPTADEGRAETQPRDLGAGPSSVAAIPGNGAAHMRSSTIATRVLDISLARAEIEQSARYGQALGRTMTFADGPATRPSRMYRGGPCAL
jgi:hypothetical protein